MRRNDLTQWTRSRAPRTDPLRRSIRGYDGDSNDAERRCWFSGKGWARGSGAEPQGRRALESLGSLADPRRDPAWRGTAGRHGAVLLGDHASHWTLAERQVPGQGAVVRSGRRLGQGQPTVHGSAI